ncbi:MAG TPA: SMC-Scp complex subunit ScpB [Parcubacteria group bacterium]|jgi:segregation and condensation protein B|nr:SMC-Scp complex subunit ScpB [Parcubacteria group bacterium]
MELEKKIEAILFYTAEPTKVSFLAKTLEVKSDEINEALVLLSKSLETRGIKLINHNDEVSLVTSPELAPLIERIIKEERERDLGKAGIETLTIIAYKGPVTKKEIEYIRGVNSQYAIRNLLLRGLIDRSVSKTDERMVVYNITSDTIRFLGIKSVKDLPEYEDMNKQLEVSEELENTEE